MEAIVNKTNELKAKEIGLRKKITGGVILQHKPDFPKTKLQEHFVKFNSKFDNTYDMLNYLNDNTVEQLIEDFIK